jgi:hypothetical protein
VGIKLVHGETYFYIKNQTSKLKHALMYGDKLIYSPDSSNSFYCSRTGVIYSLSLNTVVSEEVYNSPLFKALNETKD